MRATKKDGDRQLLTRWRQVSSWSLEYWIIVHKETTFPYRCWARTRKQVVEGAWEEPEANFCSTTMKPRYDDLATYDIGFVLWHQVKHLWWEARALVDKPKWNSNMYYLSWLTDDWMRGLMYVHHRLLTIYSFARINFCPNWQMFWQRWRVMWRLLIRDDISDTLHWVYNS